MSISRKRRKKMSEEEKEELEMSIELADLMKPRVENGLDMTLFTHEELRLMKILRKEHDDIFRKRAEELRFYPDAINNKEYRAVFRCMNYKELEPYYKIIAIQEKNRRLQRLLARDKVEIRRYCQMTREFSQSSFNDNKDLPDMTIAKNTETYFKTMLERNEKVFEEPFYFLTPEHRENVLRNCLFFVLEDDQVQIKKEELEKIIVVPGKERFLQ